MHLACRVNLPATKDSAHNSRHSPPAPSSPMSSASCWRDSNLYSCGKVKLNQSLLYNNVGIVKLKNNNTSPRARQRLSRAPAGRSSKTLDSLRRAHTIARVERSEAQFS